MRSGGGYRLDTAPFVAALEHAAQVAPVVLGKPAGPFYYTALDRIAESAKHTVMVGDDVNADIAGAQRAGLKTVLVRTGRFRQQDLNNGVTPDAVLDSIAEVPQWWQEHFGRP